MTIIDTFLWWILSVIYRRPVGRYGFEGPLPAELERDRQCEPWRAAPEPPSTTPPG